MKTDFREKIRTQKGFSLLEMIVVIVIIGVLVTVTTGILGKQTQTYLQSFNRSLLLSEGRKALRLMNDEFKKVAPDSISVMNATTFQFSDINANQIQYLYSNNILYYQTEVLIKNLYSSPFSYLTSNKNATTDPDSLRYVRVSLSLQLNNETVQLQRDVYVRN